MRTGENPAKRIIPAFRPERVAVALLVYIPEQSGYFEQSLRVLDLQIDSLRANTTQPFNLLIFDNGSCPEVKAELLNWQNQGRVDMLFSSSHNHGKAGSINWVFSALTNELIVFSDSDVFFRQGWLEESLKIYAAFPNAGMIAAQPSFYDNLKGKGTAAASLNSADFELYSYTPSREVVAEYVKGLGFGEEVIAKYIDAQLPAVRAKSSQVEAVLAASHMQFMIASAIARQVAPIPAEWALSPEEDQALNKKVDACGFLHLSPLKPYVVHMGNNYDPSLRAELGSAYARAEQPPSAAPTQTHGLWERIASNPRLRPHLRKLYKRLFQALANTR
jgi:hypothetical protein